LKYAEATGVSLIIEGSEAEVRMIIEDNGVGFDVAAAQAEAQTEQHLGLLGMHERVALLGGTLVIESEPGSGTAIFVRIPLEKNMQEK
jgi:signal transduction histidine kinase